MVRPLDILKELAFLREQVKSKIVEEDPPNHFYARYPRVEDEIIFLK